MTRLYSYVVVRDFGFAPNPFYGWCTLATCKPNIRRVAQVGDWVVGSGSVARQQPAKLVYLMRVKEALTFDDYWLDPRFLAKRPSFDGSTKQAYGDNIYHRAGADQPWLQENSHHSHLDGTPNEANVANDTQANRVLVANDFTYWGGTGPTIPERFRGFVAGRNHKSNFTPQSIEDFLAWARSFDESGCLGTPLKWEPSPAGGRRRRAA